MAGYEEAAEKTIYVTFSTEKWQQNESTSIYVTIHLYTSGII